MTATELLTATAQHVAGPPEKDPTDSAAGWVWVQRCLRCDRQLGLQAGFWPLGAIAIEYANGSLLRAYQPKVETVPLCEPPPLHPRMVIVEET